MLGFSIGGIKSKLILSIYESEYCSIILIRVFNGTFSGNNEYKRTTISFLYIHSFKCYISISGFWSG